MARDSVGNDQPLVAFYRDWRYKVLMPPDYSSQLNRIANALNRTQTPQWVYILFGSLLTVIVQLLLKYFEHLRKQYKMRRVAYSELLMMYEVAARLTVEIPNNESRVNQKARHQTYVREMYTFRAMEYCDKDYDTFVSLGDRFYIDALFRAYHAVIDDLQNLDLKLVEAANLTAQFFMTGNLNSRLAKRSGIEKGDEILENMKKRWAEYTEFRDLVRATHKCDEAVE